MGVNLRDMYLHPFVYGHNVGVFQKIVLVSKVGSVVFMPMI